MIEIEGKDISLEFDKAGIEIYDKIGIIYKNKEKQLCFEKGKITSITTESIDLIDYLTYNTKKDTIKKGKGTHTFQRDSSKITITEVKVYDNPVEFHKTMNDIIHPINSERIEHNKAIEDGKKEGEKIELLKNYDGDKGYLRKVLRFDITAFRE